MSGRSQGLDRLGTAHDLEVGPPGLRLDPEFERAGGMVILALDHGALRGMELEADRPVPARPGREEAEGAVAVRVLQDLISVIATGGEKFEEA